MHTGQCQSNAGDTSVGEVDETRGSCGVIKYLVDRPVSLRTPLRYTRCAIERIILAHSVRTQDVIDTPAARTAECMCAVADGMIRARFPAVRTTHSRGERRWGF